MIRVVLPAHLRELARLGAGEVCIDVAPPATIRSLLDALEAGYPTLSGTLRDHSTGQRRAYVRFFACGQDLSHNSQDDPLPDEVVAEKEPFLVVGAVSGGCDSFLHPERKTRCNSAHTSVSMEIAKKLSKPTRRFSAAS